MVAQTHNSKAPASFHAVRTGTISSGHQCGSDKRYATAHRLKTIVYVRHLASFLNCFADSRQQKLLLALLLCKILQNLRHYTIIVQNIERCNRHLQLLLQLLLLYLELFDHRLFDHFALALSRSRGEHSFVVSTVGSVFHAIVLSL